MIVKSDIDPKTSVVTPIRACGVKGKPVNVLRHGERYAVTVMVGEDIKHEEKCPKCEAATKRAHLAHLKSVGLAA